MEAIVAQSDGTGVDRSAETSGRKRRVSYLDRGVQNAHDRGRSRYHFAPLFSPTPIRIHRRVLMMEDHDITNWIPGLKDQDPVAQERVWNAYFKKLVRMTSTKLKTLNRRESDEEDVALSAFNSFFHAVEQQRFPKLDDREDLWKVLVVIALRKANDRRKRYFAKKRGSGVVRGESVFLADSDNEVDGFSGFMGDDPTPEMVIQTAESYQALMQSLNDEMLQKIAQLKLEGFTNREISEQLNCVERTVERKLELIRKRWTSANPIAEK